MKESGTAPGEESVRRQKRRASILEVSAKLFATRGFVGTTVRDIADEAGLLSGSLYYYFDSKEDIADALLTRLLDFTWARYAEVVEAPLSPRDKLAGIVRVSLEGIDAFPHEVVLFQKEGPYLAGTGRFQYIDDRNTDFQKMLTAILEEGVRDGEFRSDLHVDVVFRFIRDSMWPIVGWYRPGGPLSIDEVASDYLTVLLGGIDERPRGAQTA